MNASNKKQCPRCKAPFECKVDDIATCQCASVTLNSKESAYIKSRYSDCLCVNCLREMKEEIKSDDTH